VRRFALRRFARGNVLCDPQDLPDHAVGAALERRLAAGEPHPMAVSVARAKFKPADLAIRRQAQRFMMGSQHGPIVEVHDSLKTAFDPMPVVRRVTEHRDDLAIAVDRAPVDQIVDVQNARCGGSDALHKAPALLQLLLGLSSLGNLAGDGLEARDAPALAAFEQQLYVLTDPARLSAAIDRRELIIRVFLLADKLAGVKAFYGQALVLADELEVGSPDDFGLAEMKQREAGWVTKREAALGVGAVNNVARQLDDAPVLLGF